MHFSNDEYDIMLSIVKKIIERKSTPINMLTQLK